MVTSAFAMKTAVRKAKVAGIAYVGVFNSCHFGAAGQYALLAASEGAIGIVMANDTPSMAVPGSRSGVLGTNPFAYAVPALEEDPILLDIASSAVAGGKVRVAQMARQPAPAGWLVDAEGLPTTDPFVYPYRGALLPFAGHKGYGIACDRNAGGRGDRRRGAVGRPELDGQRPVTTDPPRRGIPGDRRRSLGAARSVPDAGRRADSRDPSRAQSERVGPHLHSRRDRVGRPAAGVAHGIPLPDDVLNSLRELSDDLELSADWLAG